MKKSNKVGAPPPPELNIEQKRNIVLTMKKKDTSYNRSIVYYNTVLKIVKFMLKIMHKK